MLTNILYVLICYIIFTYACLEVFDVLRRICVHSRNEEMPMSLKCNVIFIVSIAFLFYVCIGLIFYKIHYEL